MRSQPTTANQSFTDYRGTTWVYGDQGYLIPQQKPRKHWSEKRKLRAHRAFGYCLLVIMFIGYILDKYNVWVF